MATNAKREEAVMECYRRMYQQSTPKADFDELIKNPKEAFFMNYEIDVNVSQGIIEDISTEYKLNKFERSLLSMTVNLGCSPRFKKN